MPGVSADFLSDSPWDSSRYYVNDVHSLSRVCRRVRRILLPKLYRFVRLLKPSNKRRLSFLELAPMYGHMCEMLAFRIPGAGASFCTLVELLRERCKHFTNLRTLKLDIRLDDDVNSSDNRYDSSSVSKIPSHRKMTARELHCWKDLCSALPRISELHLYGFVLSDAVAGFTKAELPSIRILGLNLAAPALSVTTASMFNRAFPGLVNITFPRKWCPFPAWISRAFSGKRLERIVVNAPSDVDEHSCLFGGCNWAASIECLLELNALSLTSLTFSSYKWELASERSPLPYLTTLVFNDVEFMNNEAILERVLRPFLSSPLKHLGLDNCPDVPEAFCHWLDPKSGNWPGLKTLSLENLETTVGPGDDLWDDEDPEERETWDRAEDNDDVYWRSHSRIALEAFCDKRGIKFTSEWYWFEGYG